MHAYLHVDCMLMLHAYLIAHFMLILQDVPGSLKGCYLNKLALLITFSRIPVHLGPEILVI